jgi:hypothetical protein
MAWENVNYSCGHSERQQFYGKGSERIRRREWMERGVCPDCYREEKRIEREKENQVAAEQAKEIGLPDLVGSEKQVAWANTIRKNALSATQNTIRKGYIADTDEKKAKIAVAFDARKKLETETSAKWFIDNRADLDTYVRDCVKAAFNM